MRNDIEMDYFEKNGVKIPTWTRLEERHELERLAKEVVDGGLILEVGCMFGGTAALLAFAAPRANIITIDTFKWQPVKGMPASLQLAQSNLSKIGVPGNVKVVQSESNEYGKGWKRHIDLLWIDGGHEYDPVFHDLLNFGVHADVIALHDFKGTGWEDGVGKAVEDFLFTHETEFMLAYTLGSIAVLRRPMNGDG